MLASPAVASRLNPSEQLLTITKVLRTEFVRFPTAVFISRSPELLRLIQHAFLL